MNEIKLKSGGVKQKFLKAAKVFFLALFLAAEFFGFGMTQVAQAACTYSITRMDAQGSAIKTETLNINASISRSGTSGECANTMTVVFLAKANYDEFSGGQAIHMDSLELTRRDVPFGTLSTQNIVVPYPLSQLDWGKIPNQNQLQLFMRVYANGSFVRESAVWNTNITGGSGSVSSGAKSITLSFDRASYNNGEFIDVAIKANGASGAPDVEIVTSVNGTVVGTFNQTGANLAATQTQRVTVSKVSGFKDGTNSVKVQMFVQGSNRQVLYAEGSSQVSAAGIGTTATGSGAGTGSGTGSGTGAGSGTGSGSGTGAGSTTGWDCTKNPDPSHCIYNPLPEDELTHMFLVIIKGFLAIVGIWAVMFIIVGGFRMVMAAGNEEQYAAAKKTITWAILGVVIALLSFSIIAIVQNVLQSNVQTLPSGMIIIQTLLA